MSYDDKPSQILRLGDVVQGFPLTASGFSPTTDGSYPGEFHVAVKQPQFSVVLSPCCSIGPSTVMISPLLKIQRGWFKNPFFANDFTVVNRPMTVDQALTAEELAKLSSDERQKRLDAAPGGSYVHVELFVFAPHDLLPEYTISWQGERTVRHYMVDFRRAHRVECQDISYPQKADSAISRLKRLQLSTSARKELRDKLAFFYGRVPAEDRL